MQSLIDGMILKHTANQLAAKGVAKPKINTPYRASFLSIQAMRANQ